ncbi:MAG: hypothetical protein AAGA05_13065 [Pseudomonadota bacterium]
MRFGIVLTLVSVVLAAVMAGASYLLLQACALAWPPLERFASCRPQAELAAEQRLAALDLARIDLEREIYDLERELAATQCIATGPDPRRPLIEKGWNNEILPMLYGCWDVSLDYQTRNVDTDAVASYTEWQMCFDAKGDGRQIMRDADGVVCEGPVTATYADSGLTLIETDNLPCGDGGYIHRREISCQLAANGAALCSTLQPETGGQADVGFARRVLR